MEYIKWDDSLSVKIKEIDDQHKKLIEMINEFYTHIIEEKKLKDNLLKLLDELAEYTKFHFSTEEKYMDEFNFEYTDFHKKEHAEFINKVFGAKKRINEGKMVFSVEITNFLKDWLVNHIKGTDQNYIECFHDHGLK